jgi:hypothetical protein
MTKKTRGPLVIELGIQPDMPPSWLIGLPRGAKLMRADARHEKPAIVTSTPSRAMAIRLVFDVDQDAPEVATNILLVSPGLAVDGATAIGCAVSPLNGMPMPIYTLPATAEQLEQWEERRKQRDAEERKAIAAVAPRPVVDVPTASVLALVPQTEPAA